MIERSRDPERPAFRALDVHRVAERERSGLVLVDPLGLVEGQVFIPDPLVPIVAQFDGRRTIAEVGAAAAEALGEPVPEEFVADLVRQLDEGLLLESPLFRATLEETARGFAAQQVRPASHAGTAGYPRTKGACHASLDAVVAAVAARRQDPPRAAPRGLVAPHIDLERGRAGYAEAYGYLASCAPADLYVIFGTGHRGPAGPVTGLAMDWQTPLGTVRTDREFVAAIHRRIGEPDPLDVFLHRGEHSIEFQVLFLAHRLAGQPFEVAAFLTGALPSRSGDPTEEEYCVELLETFRAAARQSEKRVCFVAGADLAHRGPVFGDRHPVDDALLDRLRAEEIARLARLESGDPGGFHRSVEALGNPDRVCGASPIFLTAALAGGPGELLHYGQAHAEDRSQVVSFCSLVFTG